MLAHGPQARKGVPEWPDMQIDRSSGATSKRRPKDGATLTSGQWSSWSDDPGRAARPRGRSPAVSNTWAKPAAVGLPACRRGLTNRLVTLFPRLYPSGSSIACRKEEAAGEVTKALVEVPDEPPRE